MSTRTGAHAAEERESEGLVAVRRNVWLSGLVAGLAGLIGAGYLLRGATALDTVVGVLLLLLAALHGAALVAARTPVLVADEHGIRLRVGHTWRGLPWGSVRQVVVERADNPLRESRLVVVPRDAGSTTDYLDGLGRLHMGWNRRWYGAPLSVPLGMTTLTDSTDIGSDLADLAAGRTDVVQLRGRQLAQLDDVVAPPRDEELELVEPVEIPELESVLEEQVEPVADVVPEPEPVPDPVAPVRALNQPARVEVRMDLPAISGHAEAVEPSPAQVPEPLAGHVPAQRLPGEIQQHTEDTVPVPDLEHAEAWEVLPIEIVSDDLSVHAPGEPPHEPVIGPKIVHAREMLDMDIDELSQRTRIRPHVLEAIEVDDFGPCGGDFYARGHLTAIARVLGLTLEPLMKEYDERYAGGPINARRVFEAELATGLSSGMRATRGGPQWTMLIGAVLCLTLVWGVARLISGNPAEVAAPPASSGDSAGLAANRQPITSPLMKTTKITVTAAHAGAHVVVRDRTGKILWSGDLRMTHSRKVVGLAPFKVSSDNAGAIEVTVAGDPRGTLGTAGEAGSKRFS
jgi:hypothetical protein